MAIANAPAVGRAPRGPSVPYLQVSGVNQVFAGVPVLEGVNLDIRRGEFVSLIGHSGCGKSTLLNLIAGLLRPTTGSITLDGERVTKPGADRGMVFQSHGLLPWLSVYDNVRVPMDAVYRDTRQQKEQVKAERIERVLRAVGLWEHRDKKPGELSGGMRQRCAVARAFAVRPRVLLLDEPFGAVDALTKSTLHDELMSLWSRDAGTETVVMVTHDIDEAIYLSDRVVVMSNGPRARVGAIVDIDIPRPRDKRTIARLPAYVQAREQLMGLLIEGGAGHA
jgi:nitrate/nitrite transport system ATP-binding protein